MGASERVMEYLDRPPAAQLGTGRTLPSFSGRARPYPSSSWLCLGVLYLTQTEACYCSQRPCLPDASGQGLHERHCTTVSTALMPSPKPVSV